MRFVVAALLLTLPAPAVAQSNTTAPRRLSRIDDTAMVGDMTIGQLVVSHYSYLQREYLSKFDEAQKLRFSQVTVCGSTAQLLGYELKVHKKALSKADQALVKSSDKQVIMRLIIGAIGALDQVPASSIAADEAIGPGVYHNAILGADYAVRRCRLLG